MKTLDNLNAISGGAHTGRTFLTAFAVMSTLLAAACLLSMKANQYSNSLDTRDALEAAKKD